MPISIDLQRFEQGHELFLTHMLKKGGEPFLNFNHPFFRYDEVDYKVQVSREARDTLQVDKWPRWRKQPGKILAAVSAACSPRISQNLLEHRYGRQKPFVKARSAERRAQLESALYALFTGSSAPKDFGERFDPFADFLRQSHLGCAWPFVTYLAFLVAPQRYFPIRPSRFQRLLDFYRVDVGKLSGHVSWAGYQALRELAGTLRERLLRYGNASAIEIQSYMWVVAYLVDSAKQVPETITAVNFAEELQRRMAAAQERERIGVLGEEFVYLEVKRRLEKAGRRDLAKRVQLVSSDGNERGYDIRSFRTSGEEIHIEVKATSATPDQEFGFWLSDTEKRVAEEDASWRIYRVWDINLSPTYEDIGNVVTTSDGGWEVSASSWFVRKR